MKKHVLIFVTLLLLFSASSLKGQAPAPPIDNAPLERPNYLTIFKIKNGDSESYFTAILDSVKKYGFSIVQNDLKEKLIVAEKHVGFESKNYDKIIIWFERDFQQPLVYVKVFLLCGRYKYIIGAKSGVFRIQLSKIEEELLFKELTYSIKSISNIN